MYNTRVCRITGLKSAKGQKLNGVAARVSLEGGGGDRLPVCIDGEPDGPVALKRSNIDILPDGAPDYGIGVGRGTLRDTQFQATAVDARLHRIVGKQMMSGGACRSRGNLVAIEELFKYRKQQRLRGPLLVMATDLNVARAVNRIAAGDQDVKMDGPPNRTLQAVAKYVRKEAEGDNMVLIKFMPHRVDPDLFGGHLGPRRGHDRLIGVVSGCFKIYPSALEDYHDALEVRYVYSTQQGNTIVAHETFLDYGVEETGWYVRHAVAMGETERLDPAVLSQVDPRAFFGAVLHIKAFVTVLENNKLTELITAWNGVSKRVNRFGRKPPVAVEASPHA